MKIVKKRLIYALGLFSIAGIACAAILWTWYSTARSGEILISQHINNPIEIYHDAYGVPHIYAKNEEDLFFGWGYAVAYDRMWQMEKLRRQLQGRRSEIYGKKYVEHDIKMRTLGFVRYAEQSLKLLNPEIKKLLESYARGVNFLLLDKEKRSKNFTKYEYEPEPWTVVDILCIEKYLAWSFKDGGMIYPQTFFEIFENKDKEKIKELLLYNYKFYLQGKNKRALYQKEDTYTDIVSMIKGSNCWAVDGEKSSSGKPMLASDPHMSIPMPSYWHEIHLAIPEKNFHCAGVSIPGGCIIYIGRTAHVAWGLTKSYIDCVDRVEEKLHPENPNKYWDGSQWEPFALHTEKIKVKDAEDIEIVVKENEHGRHLVKKDDSTSTIKMKLWTGYAPSEGTQSFIKAYQAQTVFEFISSMEPMRTPVLNMNLADNKGNIAFYVFGKVLRRTFWDGITIMPGSKRKGISKLFIPYTENPHEINPKSHFVAAANNLMVDEKYPYYLYEVCAPDYRYDRIAEFITNKDKVNIKDMMNLQLDIVGIRAREICPIILNVCKDKFSSSHHIDALDILAQWDYVYNKEAIAPTIFEVFYKQVNENIFKDIIPDNVLNVFKNNNYYMARIMRNIWEKGYSEWLDDDKIKAKEKFNEIILLSFTEAIDKIIKHCGEDIDDWKWGNIHQRELFDKSVVQLNGGPETVNRGGGFSIDGRPQRLKGPAYRFVVDFADEDIFYYSSLPYGQSERSDSQHYTDQLDLWIEGKYKKVYRNKKDIINKNHTLLKIIPLERERKDD